MDKMGEKRDMFKGLGCDEEIANVGEPHIPFNRSPERERDERSDRDRFRDDYVINSFSQSTQAWKLRAEEDQRRYAAKFENNTVEKDLIKCVGEDLNVVIDLSADEHMDVEDTSIEIEIVKVAGESSKTLHIRKKLKSKERMKNRTIN